MCPFGQSVSLLFHVVQCFVHYVYCSIILFVHYIVCSLSVMLFTSCISGIVMVWTLRDRRITLEQLFKICY